jgi:tetratricopeptide (TPR) repeat protein
MKNDGMVSQTLAFQGDAAYYRGDSKSARAFYEQALEAATRSKEPDRVLLAKVDLARVALQEGQVQQAITAFRQLMQQADELGLPNLSGGVLDFRGQGHDQEPSARAGATGARAYPVAVGQNWPVAAERQSALFAGRSTPLIRESDRSPTAVSECSPVARPNAQGTGRG